MNIGQNILNLRKGANLSQEQLAGDDQAARDKVWAEWNSGTPNGKPQDPIDIANMVAFLCSEEARYITAQNIGVDGGYTF